MDYISKSPSQTKDIARKIASQLKGGEVICLYGDLGAGKTVFVSGLINYFLPGKRVLSPTFIIVRHYQLDHQKIKRFLHVDLYRMTNTKEIQKLEFFESMYRLNTIVAIEWAEKLDKHMPQKRIDISLKTLSDQSISIIIDQTHAIA
ncbi:tRNA (adenosine(37)-N6)-threonylcarbamoyltransferase complex ATPase subunit type 1 TsaE [Candidatus Gottesmanbacteria bacterium]|nr:tRNA (adenosine(37)-N6)-threonylcarbamoyltransferase complex ATPase subunit type 1 TsaE [Candidatus Gottesmanbacteria bacterium]